MERINRAENDTASIQEVKTEPELAEEFEYKDIGTVEEFETINKLRSKSLCRLCARRSNDLIQIFVPNESYENISEKIQRCLSIVVTEIDTLPKQACRNCLKKLELCYEFRNSVAQAEKQLLIFEERRPDAVFKETEECDQSSKICKEEHDAKRKDDNNDKANLEEDSHPDEDNNERIVQGTEEIIKNEKSDWSNEVSGEKPSNDLMEMDNEDSIPCKKELDESMITNRSIYGEAFNTENRFRVQASDHTYAEDRYLCSSCGEVFDKEIKLREHHTEHTGYGGLEMDAKTVKKSSEQSGKKFIAELKQRFQNICHKSDTETEITCGDNPRTEEDPDPEKRPANLAVACTLCRNRFHPDVLAEHKDICCAQRFDKSKKRYSCVHCGKGFNRKVHINSHIATHTRGQSYNCDICMRRFRTKRSWEHHQKMHTKKLIFECSMCGKRFLKSREMKTHARIHWKPRISHSQ